MKFKVLMGLFLILMLAPAFASAYSLEEYFTTDTTGDYTTSGVTWNSAGNVTITDTTDSRAYLFKSFEPYTDGTNISVEFTIVSMGSGSYGGTSVEMNDTGCPKGWMGGFRNGAGTFYDTLVQDCVALRSDTAIGGSPVGETWRMVLQLDRGTDTFYQKMWPADQSEHSGWNTTYVNANVGPGSAWGFGMYGAGASGGYTVHLHTLLYNSSSWDPPVTDPTLDIRIQDIYDGANLEGLNVTLADGTSNTTQSDGIAHFENATTQSFNVTDPSGLYFDYNSSVNPTENATTTYEVSGAFINFTATDLFGNAISSFNVSSGSQTNSTSSGSVQLYLRPNATLNVTASSAGYYNLTQEVSTTGQDLGSENITGMYDSIYQFSATDAVSGSPVSSFTINTTESTVPYSVNANTSSGILNVSLMQGYDYTFFIDSTGYALSNITAPANASFHEYNFSLLPQNSVYLFFYDEVTLASITQNVSVEYTNGSVTIENSSLTGDLLIQDLAPGTWTFTASSSGYVDRQYIATVTSRSTQTLDIYLLNSSVGEETLFTVKDSDTADVIPGATITMQQDVAGNWVTVGQKITDAFGIGVFDLVDGKEYQFIIDSSGYTTKTGVFTRTEPSYIVPLNEDNTQNFLSYLNDFTYVTSPNEVSPESTDFSILTSSPDGRLEWFSVTVSLNNSNTTSNVTGSPSGGTATQTVNLSGFGGYTAYVTYSVKSLNFDDPLTISESFYIFDIDEGNYTFGDFMTHYADDSNGLNFGSRGIIVTILAVLLAALVGAVFGFEAGVLLACVIFIVASFYDWMNWSITIVVVAAAIGSIVTSGRRP